MKFTSIIGVLPALDDVVKVCGEAGFFHPDKAAKFYSNSEKISPLVYQNPFSEPLKNLTELMKSTGVQPNMVDIGNLDIETDEIKEYVSYMSTKLKKILDSKQKIEKEIIEYKSLIDRLSHFVGLDLNLQRIFSCEYIKVRFGKLPRESYQKLDSYKDNPYVLFFPCTNDENFYYGVYFSPIKNIEEVDRIFARLYFERLKLESMDETPEEKLAKTKILLEQKEEELKQNSSKIEEFWKMQKDQCMRVYTRLTELNICFDIKKYAYSYNDSFILVGWIPEEDEEDFTKTLENIYGIEFTIEKLDDEKKHLPPVKLKNNKFSKPFEMFVSMYGLPSYGEIDPTVLVSISYTLIFGIMFGDLGQGLVLAVLGALAWKFKKMQLGKILTRCGISAAFFGTVYGSVFGFEHALDPMYKTVFGLNEKPIEVMESATVNNIIYSSVFLGVFVIILSMCFNIYSSIKQKKYDNAVLGPNGIVGLIFYASLVFGAVGQLAFGMKIFNIAYILIFILLPLLIMFFKEPLEKLLHKEKDWKPQSWGQYIVQNFFEMFEILLSYITNTVSFLRVGAYVLGHVGMMMVVFTIANLFSTPGYIIAVILGNIFVIALEGLLVGIQVLRLEFYEIFSRFFEGHGKPFKPVIASKG